MHEELRPRSKAVLIAVLLAATYALGSYLFLVLLSLVGLLRDELTLAAARGDVGRVWRPLVGYAGPLVLAAALLATWALVPRAYLRYGVRVGWFRRSVTEGTHPSHLSLGSGYRVLIGRFSLVTGGHLGLLALAQTGRAAILLGGDTADAGATPGITLLTVPLAALALAGVAGGIALLRREKRASASRP